ncbi:TonB-dependent receptor [Mucilaginibacter sp.]|uniref:TonB-dependent receptor n=1 Tax=Mucilaginibacter sp. TaxID=1882438 RepID=UPI0025ED25BE|nr:TonB-dependent receptor [Mucilaginibacter sp.]
MKKLLLLFFTLAIYCQAIAQNRSSISGVVNNANSQPVAGASVALLNTNYSTVTNAKGEFAINNIPQGTYTLHITSKAYAERSQVISVSGKGQLFNINLQDAGKQLDEVVITAQKREEQLQQVPVSVSTLSANDVQAYHLQNLKDITGIVPNLYSAGPGDNRNVTGLRGIATTSYDPAVVTYIDGINQFSLDTYIPQLFDVERIEVLRGPQGTLYGRNALGGVINVITKKPSNQTSGFAEAEFGNYGEQRYSLGLRAPLIKDKLFLGVAGVYSGFNGFYTNEFNNTKFDKQHYFLGNYYLKFLANEKLTFTLNVKNYENRNNGPFTLAGNPADAISNPFKVDQNATTKIIDNIFNASLSANYAGSGFNFTSVTSYQKNYRYYTTPIDGDFSPIDAVSLINNYGSNWNDVKVGTQEFRFSSPASSLSPLKWTAGLYGFYRSAPTKTGTHFGADAAAVGAPFPDFTSINTNIEHNYGFAAFGQVVYTINPQWDITAGLRYDLEHKKEEVKGEFQPDGGDIMVTQADTSSKANFKAFTPKLTVAYHVSENNNLFASYSRGFRAGGISQLGSDPSQPPLYAYKPEYSDNYEIGSKNTLFNKRVRLNIAAFYTFVNNAQVPTLVLPDAITVTKNAGKLQSKGIEAEIAATLFKGLDVDYNFGYTHARYKDLLVASNGNAVNLQGNHQVYTPEVTSMLALQYAYELDNTHTTRLVARGEWRYLGKQYFDLANQIEQKAYNIFNARAGVSLKNYEVFVWGHNLANKTYIDYAYDFGATHLGNPRTYGVTLRANF